MLSRVAKALESLGYEIEWSDEWAECSTCHGAVRTSPNGWGWKRSYYTSDDSEIYCHECVKEDPMIT
jgi:ferredoxin